MPDFIEIKGIKVPISTHDGKTIVVGCDHRGFETKKLIINLLKQKNYKIIDVGTFSDERCDYPEFSNKIGKEVSLDILNRAGIGICGSGIGILICAGKYKGIIPARCLSPEDSKSSRKHNNSNVLGVSADLMKVTEIIETVEEWLKTPFYSMPETEESYLRRYVMTRELEENK